MKNDVVEVTVKAVMPTSNGCALFLGNGEKAFVIYVDQSVGTILSMAINGTTKERPLTHDLMHQMLQGLGAKLLRVIINDAQEGTFFARCIVRMENEIDTKFIELDARPSDSITLAVLQEAPIFVDHQVFNSVEDMSEVLEKILSQKDPLEDPDDDANPF